MEPHTVPTFTIINALGAAGVAVIYILLSSLLKEPIRQQFNAIMIAGAGAAYLSGGLGIWEFPFCALMAIVAYKGLGRYYFIGIGWLLHTCWDIVHHLYANPIIPFSPASSAGCAVCDSILAIWFFCGAPNVFRLFSGKQPLLPNLH